MTATALPVVARRQVGLRTWLAPAGLLGGLGVIVAARWWSTRAGLDPLAVGAAFGLALCTLAVTRSRTTHVRRPTPNVVRARSRRALGAIAVGGALGLGLVGLVVAGATISGVILPPGLGRAAAPFLPWAAITVLVAAGEETLLRGRLLDSIRANAGLAPAIAVTTIAFALIHVPLYGWHVVPLDLAVGLAFAGLRLATRSLAAPIEAHAVADLATWWL